MLNGGSEHEIHEKYVKPGTHGASKQSSYLADGDAKQLATSVHASEDYAS